jgi:hypothetical protein
VHPTEFFYPPSTNFVYPQEPSSPESDDSLESGNDSDNDVLNIFMNLLTIINNDNVID